MKYFKYLGLALYVVLTATSCRKSNEGTATPLDTIAIIHQIKFAAPVQYASTAVVGDSLKIIFYENVSLFIPIEGLNLSYSLHLKEDFSESALVNFNYTTVTEYGDVTYDWVDDNLNDVTAKTEKDTVLNGQKVTEITVQRPFTFSQGYTSQAAAVAEQNALLATTTDKIVFSSYVLFTTTYPATTTTVSLYYVNATN